MNQLITAAATVVLTTTSLFASAAHALACDAPETGADNPEVTGHPLSDAAPAVANSREENSPPARFDSTLVVVSWTPGIDRSGDPNTEDYFGHDGHSITTRVLVTDAVSGEVVRDVTVPQYDYAHVERGGVNPATTSFSMFLPEGRYEARVQSVFTQHDEIRFGILGAWQKMVTIGRSPQFDADAQVARFEVQMPVAVEEDVPATGCTAATDLVPGLTLLMALTVLVRRRRHAPAHPH